MACGFSVWHGVKLFLNEITREVRPVQKDIRSAYLWKIEAIGMWFIRIRDMKIKLWLI